MVARRLRVLVVDDSPLACRIVEAALAFDDDVDVVGTALDGLSALEMIRSERPDVVTLDLAMPHLDGLGVLDALDAHDGRPGVVVVAIEADARDLRRRGVLEVVHKRTTEDDELFDLLAQIVGAVKLAGRRRAGGPHLARAGRRAAVDQRPSPSASGSSIGTPGSERQGSAGKVSAAS